MSINLTFWFFTLELADGNKLLFLACASLNTYRFFYRKQLRPIIFCTWIKIIKESAVIFSQMDRWSFLPITCFFRIEKHFIWNYIHDYLELDCLASDGDNFGSKFNALKKGESNKTIRSFAIVDFSWKITIFDPSKTFF